jgi:hypothetical protein
VPRVRVVGWSCVIIRMSPFLRRRRGACPVPRLSIMGAAAKRTLSDS